MDTTGRIHSIETCGTVDGPGIRYVIFTQGCPLRCLYCHNPDTWDPKKGNKSSVNEIIEDIVKYKSYMNFSGGGVTATGGEPLLQPDFVYELFKRCKEENIHTALDTSGFIYNEKVLKVLELTDLVLLDIKCIDKEQYKKITSVQLQPTLDFMNHLKKINKPVWVRYVLVPGLTDKDDYIESLARYLTQFDNIEKIEILPFHKMGEYKWQELGLEYKLSDTQEPKDDAIEKVKDFFKKYNLKI